MRVEPCGDHITLHPQSNDELKLLACIVEALRVGGKIKASSSIGIMELVFEGDASEVRPKKKRKPRKAKK